MDSEAIVTKQKGTIESTDLEGTGTARRNGDIEARHLVEPSSPMSNEDVQVTVFRQSDEKIPHHIHSNSAVNMKKKDKFKQYAPKEDLKRVIKARKMLQ